MKVLVTIDGSKESKSVIPFVARLASETHADVTMLTVVHAEGAVPVGRQGVTAVTPGGSPLSGSTMQFEAVLQPVERKWAESRDQAVQRAEAEGLEMLEDFAGAFEGGKPKLRVLMGDDPAKAIIDFAHDEKFDIIAMTTHGRSGLREVVQGSVAAAVMRSGVAPVLMVRPQK